MEDKSFQKLNCPYQTLKKVAEQLAWKKINKVLVSNDENYFSK